MAAKFGPYEVVSEIGRGGMATVYLARDPQGNQVALKVLPPQFTHDPTFRGRFAREVATLRHLNHPAIVPILDQGEADGPPYLVMRFMSGGTLADRMARGRLNRQEAASVLGRIAEALDYAHQQGVVHRDVKPANIYFDSQGNSFLGDFGLVELANATRSFTGSAVVGTPSYMSPEQVKGGRKMDGRSDQYALAIVLYEMLAGTPPYQADTPTQQMMKHVLEPVPRIREHNPDVDPIVEAILTKALAKNPEERYPTCAAFVQAVANLTPPVLQPQLTNYDLTAAPPGGLPPRQPTLVDAGGPPAPLTPPMPQRSRLPWLWIAVPAVCLLMVLLAGAVGAVLVFSPKATATVALAATATEQPPSPAPTATPGPSLAPPTALPAQASVTPLPLITDTPVPTGTSAPPKAADDNAQTNEDQAVLINVLQNDNDPDNNLAPGSLSVAVPPQHGQAAPRGTGILEYTPAADFSGTDSFSYQVCDTSGQCSQAVVAVTIAPVNDPPKAKIDFYNLQEDTSLSVPASGVLANDTDPEGNPLTVSGSSPALHGTAQVAADGSLTYTPDHDYCGPDALTYTVADNGGGTDKGEVTLIVGCVDEPTQMAVEILSANPAAGATIQPGATVTVHYKLSTINYGSSFYFTQIDLLVYDNPQCAGDPVPNRLWGNTGYWARARVPGTSGESNDDVTVTPNITHWGTAYVGLRVTLLAQSPPGPVTPDATGRVFLDQGNQGEVLDQDYFGCYVSPEN